MFIRLDVSMVQGRSVLSADSLAMAGLDIACAIAVSSSRGLWPAICVAVCLSVGVVLLLVAACCGRWVMLTVMMLLMLLV